MKKLNILFLDTNKKLGDNLNLSVVGNNYGNLLFYKATLELFKEHLIHFNSFSEPDLLVITTANCISNFDCNINYVGNLSNEAKKYSCRKIILSIGAQNKDTSMFQLNDTAKNNIYNLFSQMDYINLRGSYTYDLLIHNDIQLPKYHIYGCPSIILCEYPFKIKNLNMSMESKILFNAPRYKQSNCNFFENIYKLKEIDFLCQDLPYKKPNEELQLSNWKTPKGYNNWIEIIKPYDFIIGTRIHGAIMSLICEIPTLLLVIDSRTLELAETLNVPYLNIIDKEIDIHSKKDIIDIINNFKFDYDKFNRRVKARKEEFKNFINYNVFK